MLFSECVDMVINSQDFINLKTIISKHENATSYKIKLLIKLSYIIYFHILTE